MKLVLRTFNLTEEENRLLKRDAYSHGMNVSEYLRWLIEGERNGRDNCSERRDSGTNTGMGGATGTDISESK